MKRVIWIGGIAFLVSAVFFVGKLIKKPEPHPIAGIWRNDFYGACLCEADNFYLFEEGKIAEYSDRHFTNRAAGYYVDLGDGRFRVTLNHDGGTSSEWIVRPRADSWIHPPDDNLRRGRKQARTFYRPDEDSKWQTLISSAAERDAKLTTAIESHKANKAR